MNANQGAGRQRVYRATDDVYDRAMYQANRRGFALAEVIRDFLVEYGKPRPTRRRHPQRRATDRQDSQVNGQGGRGRV